MTYYMKPIEPIGHRERNLERLALRHGLTFFVDGRYLTRTSHSSDEMREATDEEIQMWTIICPEDPDHLLALVQEIRDSWEKRSGPFTINAKDYHGLKGCGRDFEPENRKDHLIQGLIGAYKGKSIYVSKSIPIGFFYEGERIPELHWHPQGGNHYIEIEPDLPAEIELRVWNTLYQFKLGSR